ncbi:MAG: tetratricopeptide repeat protein, partial [Pseudomonadales bacterium]|nr:tetratricopeptide repeat protein [Pseudomonadales bacterium]
AVYRKLGLYEDSAEMFGRSLSLKVGIATDSVAVADTLNHYSRLLLDMGENRKAEDLALRALDLYQQHPQAPQDKIAEVYDSLGAVHRKLAKYQDALKYHYKALAIGEAALGDEHPSIAQYHSNIGSVYSDFGDYDSAIEHYNKALLVFTQETRNSGAAAQTYRRLGVAHWHNEDHQLAIDYFQTGLALALETLGEDHPEVGWFYSNLGLTHSGRSEYDKAIKYHQKLLKLSESPAVYNNLAFEFMGKGDYETALEYLHKALNIDAGENPLVTATIYETLGQLYTLKIEYNKAIQYFQRALSFAPTATTPNHPLVADIHQGMGKAFERKPEYKRALQHYETALEIRMKKFGAEHSETRSVQADIDRVQGRVRD